MVYYSGTRVPLSLSPSNRTDSEPLRIKEYVRTLLDRFLYLLAASLAPFGWGDCHSISWLSGWGVALLQGRLYTCWLWWWWWWVQRVPFHVRLSRVHPSQVGLLLHLAHHLPLQVQILVPQPLPVHSAISNAHPINTLAGLLHAVHSTHLGIIFRSYIMLSFSSAETAFCVFASSSSPSSSSTFSGTPPSPG